LTLNLSGNKRFGEFRTKTCISTPILLFWQGNGKWQMAQIQPPTLTLDPKLINFYAKV